MAQPPRLVSNSCGSAVFSRQSLPFNAMHRSRKALDKNCQHGLVFGALLYNKLMRNVPFRWGLLFASTAGVILLIFNVHPRPTRFI
jgi:hypothetical protein